MVAMLIQDILAEVGCEVVGVAARFDDALEKAEALAVDVAILDVNLNGRDTFAIAGALTRRGIAFIFATGYEATHLPEPLRKMPILQKPFRREDLERAIRAALIDTGS